MKELNYGYFIVIEGCDGSGKTTIANLLKDKLIEDGYDTIYTREPGGSEIGEKIRNLVLYNKTSPEIATLLFAASMNADIKKIINPALEEKKIIICDRFVRSTYVYQGYSKQRIDENIYQYLNRINTFNEIERFACCDITPDIEFILDVSPNVAWERTHKRNEKVDVFEADGYKAFEDRAEAYLNAMGDELYYTASDNDYELKHIDANRNNIDEIVNECYNYIISMINEDNGNG